MRVEDSRLTILETIPRPKDERRYQGTTVWVLCKCQCGNRIKAPAVLVRNGTIRSCGCLRNEVARQIMNEKTHSSDKYKENLVVVEYEGKTMNLHEWAKEKNIPYSTLLYRHRVGVEPPDLFDRYIHAKRRRRYAEQ